MFLDIGATRKKTNNGRYCKTSNEVLFTNCRRRYFFTDNIHSLLKAGADKVSINSATIKNPNIIKQSSEYFGNQCIVVAVDLKKKILIGMYAHMEEQKTQGCVH